MGLPNIDLFCPYSTEITSIECHCSRMIDFPFLSVPFDTLKLLLSNYTAGEEAANNSVYFVILFLFYVHRFNSSTSYRGFNFNDSTFSGLIILFNFLL